ncbi:MAG: hypothetical protein HOG89_03105 [Candidatus Peribacter sp.]|nr:hypothetical protein [Candidatus Peribacter sp.]MBT4392653.1 hypothetical protein [Candidatus Peribacter sp.]MBT4600730.1 hypothetical protein [Candidatus Peribacter sp.]MBT5148601.1 hypothetical protein [Candidatus Peribacter sp.]MBT5637803.1 hypothetical protein [Candidatus Peribacter sp.]
MSQEPISNQALVAVGTITAVVVAIYAGNWQADLLAQTGAPSFDPQSVCGNEKCEPGEDRIICASCARDEEGNPMGNCPCEMMCEKDCKKPDDDRCKPLVCPTGKQHPRCSADGSTINYFRDPCGPICPSILCSAPPKGCKYVPPYKENEQGCQASCGELACEEQCQTVDCVAPPEGCKYVNQRFDGECQVNCGEIVCETKNLCGNGRCEEGEEDKFDPGGCGPGADSRCLGPPSRFIPGSCPRDCKPLDKCAQMFCPNGCRDGQCLQPAAPRVCNFEGGVYQAGDVFKAPDGCNKCYCNQNGTVECTEMACVDDDDDEIAEERFRNVQFGCRDGLTLNEGGPTSCKSRKEWKNFVIETCGNHCDDHGCGETAMNVYEPCSGSDGGSASFCLSGGQRYYPGDSFVAEDGCNKCHCSENGTAACTKMACIDPPQPSFPNPNDPTDPDQGCYSTQDCGPGTICTVELGECNSGPCDAAGNCADVCTGHCVERGSNSPDFPEDPVEYEDEVKTAPVENRFSDAQTGTLEGTAANDLAQRGVIGGFPDGTFRGEKPVNRAEAAKFLLMARFGFVGEARNNNLFLDVLEGEWYVKYVVNAAELDIISGYSDRTFRPANTVNTAEFLKMLSKTFGLPQDLPHNYSDVPEGAWFSTFAGAAQQYGLFPGRPEGRLQPDKLLTRGEVAIAIYKLMENQ